MTHFRAQRGEELPAAVRAGAGGGGLRLHDGAGHGRLGDPAEARPARAEELGESRGDGSRGRPCRWPSGSCGTSTRDPRPRLDRISGKTAKPKSKQKLQSS